MLLGFCFGPDLWAQAKYFELQCISSTYYDDEKGEDVKDDYVNNDKIFLSEDYLLYFMNATYEDGPLSFLRLEALERKTGRCFQLRKFYHDIVFHRMEYSYFDFFGTYEPTGKTKVVNSYTCEEYKTLNNGKELYMYVTTELPFANFTASNKFLPGFVVSIQSILNVFGKKHVKTDMYDLKEIEYNEDFFKYIPKLKTQYPPLPAIPESKTDSGSTISKVEKELIHQSLIEDAFNPLKPKKYNGVSCAGVKSILRKKNGNYESKTCYEQNGQIKQQLLDKGKKVIRIDKNVTNYCNDKEDLMVLNFEMDLDTIFHSNNKLQHYSLVDKTNRLIVTHYPKRGKVAHHYYKAGQILQKLKPDY